MRKPLLLLALISITISGFAYNKYELLLGLRTGGGGMFYKYRSIDANVAYNGITYTSSYTEKSIGAAIPAKFEVLFGVKGFRMGYQFDYKHGIFTKFTRDFDNNSTGLPDFEIQSNVRRNVFSHYFLMEYSVPIGVGKNGMLFAVAPAFGIGGFRGFKVLKDDGSKSYYKDILKRRIALTAGINFEFTKRRFCLVVAPTYSYCHGVDKTNVTDGFTLHTISLDLAFRLNLLKPKY